jgi:cysteinyl-tRNA synthetase
MVMLSNTLSGKKEHLTPLHPKKISLYACGITPYDRAHIGHGRSYVSFDLLYRWLTFLGYEVTYVRNYTDIDDKLLHKAKEILGDQYKYPEIANNIIALYQAEMSALNCIPPQQEPRVTEHIPIIISFIQDLIDKGHAYESDGDVYFAVETFPEYGKLSRQQTDELISGTRGEVDPKKKNPLDFALWKSEQEGTFWKSPWGWGRPGWHIECSALASHYLGDEIDIHGGGRDLIFPHHENEIAQSEARSGKPFARIWVHNGLVNINKEKMSKSLGNILALEDLLKQYDPMELRFYFLLHHYRSPMEFSIEELERAVKSYRKICRLLESVEPSSLSIQELKALPITQKMIAFLEDDLNTAGAFAVLFEHMDELKHDTKQAQAVKQLLQHVFGLTLVEVAEKKAEITPEIQKLIEERENARAAKDWARADEIRDQLVKMGVEVRDKKQ